MRKKDWQRKPRQWGPLSAVQAAVVRNCEREGFPLPIGLWEMWEGAGPTVFDLSGNGHHGAILGGAPWAFDPSGSVVDLQGGTDEISVPHHPDLNITGDLSIVTIFNGSWSASGGLVCKWNSGERYFVLWTGSTTNKLEFARYTGGDYNPVSIVDANLWDGTPSFAVARSVGTDIDLFSGKLNGPLTHSVGGYNKTWSTSSNSGPLQFGNYVQGGSGYWIGKIGLVCVFNSAISDTKIAHLYDRPHFMVEKPKAPTRYFFLGGQSVTRNIAWQILNTIDRDTGWAVLAAKTADLGYRILNAIDRDIAAKILNAKDQDTAYKILNAVSRDTAAKIFNQLDSDSSWAILAKEKRATAWSILNRLDRDTAWQILLGNVVDLDVAWQIITSAGVDLNVAWAIKNAKDQITGYRIMAADTQDIAWQIANAVTRDTAWQILGAKDQQTAWGILAQISQDTSWKIFNVKDQDLAWSILSHIDQDTGWQLFDAADLDTAWDILSDIVPEPVKVFMAEKRTFIFNAERRTFIFFA